MNEAVVIGQLRVHAGGAGADPLLLCLRAVHLLETADLTPPGLPPGAILTIHRLADPLPGRLDLDAPQLAPDRAWQAALTGQLGTLAAQAERPLHQAVSAGAPAVLFADQAEMLACLALDWLAGQLLNRWWWRQVVRNQPLETAVVGTWLTALDAAPAALAHLNQRSAAVAFLRRLADEDVARLLTGLVERHRLVALGEVAQASLRAASQRGAADTAAFAGSIGQPGRGLSAWPAGSTGEKEATGEPASTSAGSSGTREAGSTVAPWQELVPADSASLSKPRQLLLGIGLALVHAPNSVRGEMYARQVVQWYEGRPSELVERAAFPPARPNLTAQSGPDERASGSRRRDHAPRDDEAGRSDAALRGEAPPSPPTGATASSAALVEGGSFAAPANARTVQVEHPGAGTGGAEAVGEAPAPAAAPAQLAAREDVALAVVEVQTDYAGLFYLVNAALGMGFYADFTQPAAEGELVLSPWAFLALIGRALIGGGLEADPVWGLLARLAGTEDTDMDWADRLATDFAPPDGLSLPEWIETTAGQVFEWIAARFIEPLAGRTELTGLAFARAGRVRMAAGRLDVVLRLDDLAIGVRMAGLDRNPGWVPAAGRTINFYYD